MYLPGLRNLVLFVLIIILLAVAVLMQSPLLPMLFASGITAYLVYDKRFWLLETVYKDRILLIKDIKIEPVVVQGRVDHLRIHEKKNTYYMAFLRVKDTDPPQPSLGRAAERSIAALHHHAVQTGIVTILREGGYDYYIWVKAPDKNILKTAISDIHRTILGYGVYLEPVDAKEALSAILKKGRNFGLMPPVFTIAGVALAVASVAVRNPIPFLLAIPFFILTPYELKMLRGTAPFTVEPTINVRSNIAASESQAEVMASGARTMALTARDGYLLASLTPMDTAIIEAQAKHAMEVIESARAGVSKLRHEFDAMKVIGMWKALQAGAAPFLAEASGTPEIVRALQTSGLSVGSPSRLNTVYSLGLFPSPQNPKAQISVSTQLVYLAPFIYIRPRTKRTPQAVYIGHGLRKDEEVWLEIDRLENVHGFLVGPYGSGKSTTARTIAIRALEKGIIPIVIDPSGEYRRFANTLGWEIIDLWDRQLDLRPVSIKDLAVAFDYISPMTDAEFFAVKRAVEQGDLFSAKTAKVELIKDYFSNPSVTVRELLDANRPFILCFGSTKTGEYRPIPRDIMRFTLSVLLAQMRDYVLQRGLSGVKYMLFVDEAHLFAKPPHLERETELTTMARMLRKFGLAIVLIAHDFRDLDPVFIRHAGWRMAMSHSDPQYVNDAVYYFGMLPSEITWFRRGIRGRAILRRGFEPWNVLVEVEPEKVAMNPA
jgi:hypothetical protein